MLSNQAGRTGHIGQNGQTGHEWSKRKLENNQTATHLVKRARRNTQHAAKRKHELLHADTAKRASPKLCSTKRKHDQHGHTYLAGGTTFVVSVETAKVRETSELINDHYEKNQFWENIDLGNSTYTTTSVMMLHLKQQHDDEYNKLEVKRNPTIQYCQNSVNVNVDDVVATVVDNSKKQQLGTYLNSLSLKDNCTYNEEIDVYNKNYSENHIFKTLQKIAWVFGIGIAWLSGSDKQPVWINCWSTTMLLVHTPDECVDNAWWVLELKQRNDDNITSGLAPSSTPTRLIDKPDVANSGDIPFQVIKQQVDVHATCFTHNGIDYIVNKSSDVFDEYNTTVVYLGDNTFVYNGCVIKAAEPTNTIIKRIDAAPTDLNGQVLKCESTKYRFTYAPEYILDNDWPVKIDDKYFYKNYYIVPA